METRRHNTAVDAQPGCMAIRGHCTACTAAGEHLPACRKWQTCHAERLIDKMNCLSLAGQVRVRHAARLLPGRLGQSQPGRVHREEGRGLRPRDTVLRCLRRPRDRRHRVRQVRVREGQSSLLPAPVLHSGVTMSLCYRHCCTCTAAKCYQGVECMSTFSFDTQLLRTVG